MKQLEVQIMQQSYLLGCPDGREARLLEAVERVDTAMTTIRDAGKVRARERIAVLAALNLAFDLADRETEDLGRHAQSQLQLQSVTSPGSADVNKEPTASGNSERLAALVKRLDDVLGADTQLL